MGNNNGNSWLNAVKKAFRSPTKDGQKRSSRRREETEQEDEERKGEKRRWIFRRNSPFETTIQHNVGNHSNSLIKTSILCADTSGENSERKQLKMDDSITESSRAIAVAEAAVATAQAAMEIIRLTAPPSSAILVQENSAALVIQSIFRGYLGRKALLALKGVVKLQALIRGHNVRRRAKMTLQCIQSLVRVQTQVCDQRRRLSCEGTRFSHINSSRKSTSRNVSNATNDLDCDPHTIEEIQALIDKAKEISLRQGKTIASILSNQRISGSDEDRVADDDEHRHSGRKTIQQYLIRNDRRNLCCSPIKTIEMDTSSRPNLSDYDHERCSNSYAISSPVHRKQYNLASHSPRTPINSKMKPIQVNYSRSERSLPTAESPSRLINGIQRTSLSENYSSCPSARPNYMAATASAMARVKSHSAPRLRAPSPNREPITNSAKKRLSFPLPDVFSEDIQRYRSIHGGQFGVEDMSNVSSSSREQHLCITGL